MTSSTTLRLRLLGSFILVALVPLLAATALAVPWYRSSIETEAQRTLGTHATVADELFSERVDDRMNQVASIARVFSNPSVRSPQALPAELKQQATTLKISYLLFIDNQGVVRGSTSGQVGHKLSWPQLEKVVSSRVSTGFVGIVPVTELVALDRAADLEMQVKVTEGGAAAQSEVAGAISVVGVAPVVDEAGKTVGSIVGVETLKLDSGFVDSVVEKVGGVATVFQNGVRVATTVKDDAGERAVGTAISDKVRAAALETGKPFRGEAFVVNRAYLAAYDPIKDPDGETIGLVFVGLDRTPYATSERNFTLGMVAVTVLGVALASAIAWFGSRSISAPLVAVSSAAEKVATGDLTVTVPESGFREARAMGSSFNTMTHGLRELIGNVGASVRTLDTVAGEISQAATFEANSASSQASAVAQTTATIEELDRSFGAVAEGAQRVLAIAEDSLEVAESGREAIEGGTEQVERLANGANGVLQAAGNLEDVARDIGQVTVVIGSIAEQTKILALNAAIEAARAGDAGKGFSVVATEIRTLADSVSTSVGRIAQLVSGIQAASKDLASTAGKQVELGRSTVDETTRTRDKFDEIYARMEGTASAAREIAAAAAQQRSAAQQIVGVMHQVSSGVSGTASAARQLADSAGDVKREAEALSEGLEGFRVGD